MTPEGAVTARFPTFDEALAAFGLGGRPSDRNKVRRGFCPSCSIAWIWWAGKRESTRHCPSKRCPSAAPLDRVTSNRRPAQGWRWWPGTVAP